MLITALNANILIPWFVLYVTLEIYVLVSCCLLFSLSCKFQRQIRSTNIFPEEFQPLLQMLPKEALPFDLSFICKSANYLLNRISASGITIIRELAQDTMFMVAGFILTQYALILSDFYIQRA